MDKVPSKVSDKYTTTISGIILHIWIDLFDYVEMDDVINLTIHFSKKHYANVKCQLKNKYLQQEMEATALSIETNLKCLCYCYFIHVTAFGFLNDIISEAANSSKKMTQISLQI